MPDDTTPEVEIRRWRALHATAAKAVNKFAKDLPDDQKVLVKKGDVLQARVVRREPDDVIIADGVLNGAPLPANIRIIHKMHWTRIDDEPVPVPPPAEPAVLAEPIPETPPAEPAVVAEPVPEETPPAAAVLDEAPLDHPMPLFPEDEEPAPAAAEPAPQPEKATPARRLRAWFLNKKARPEA